MLWTIIVILIILWLLGFLGRNISPRLPRTGGWVHLLIVIAVILIILHFIIELAIFKKLNPSMIDLINPKDLTPQYLHRFD